MTPADEVVHPRRRRSDQGWKYWALWIYRMAVPALAIVIAAIALSQTQGKVDKATDRANRNAFIISQQTAGRRVALDVLCGFSNGVEAAARLTLAAPVNPPKFRRALEKLGLPKPKDRAKVQKLLAEAYSRKISESVAHQVGGSQANKVIRSDGSINCEQLRRVSRTKGG